MCKNTDPIGAAKPPMQSAENLPTNKDPGSVEAFLPRERHMLCANVLILDMMYPAMRSKIADTEVVCWAISKVP